MRNEQPGRQVDLNLLHICNAAGVTVHQLPEEQLAVLREVVRQIMSESYIKGSNDNHKAAMEAARRAK